MRSIFAPSVATSFAFLLGAGGAQAQRPSSHRLTSIRIEIVSEPGSASLKEFSRALLQAMQPRWLPPSDYDDGLKHPWPVDSVIAVTVSPSGHIASDLQSSSDDESLDRAAWRAVKQTPFPALPSGLKDPMLKLKLHFQAE